MTIGGLHPTLKMRGELLFVKSAQFMVHCFDERNTLKGERR